VYICVFQSFGTSYNTAYETAAYSNKHPPTIPFFGRMFSYFISLSDFLFVNEVITFFFQSYFDGFRSTARETGDLIDTTQQGPVARTQTASPASPLLAGVAFFPSTLWTQTTDEALPWSCCHHGAGGSCSSGDEAVSLVVCSVDWSVLTVSISMHHTRIPLAHRLGRPRAPSYRPTLWKL